MALDNHSGFDLSMTLPVQRSRDYKIS
uniref:Uncharacterized protein n=1 Tax=Arundo donax TaxID=35708 RepID=A0A0A9AP49_ARUDO